MYQLWNKETNEMVTSGNAVHLANTIGCNKTTVYHAIKKNTNIYGTYIIKRSDGANLSTYNPRFVYSVYDENGNEILINASPKDVMSTLYISRSYLCKLASGKVKSMDGYTIIKKQEGVVA